MQYDRWPLWRRHGDGKAEFNVSHFWDAYVAGNHSWPRNIRKRSNAYFMQVKCRIAATVHSEAMNRVLRAGEGGQLSLGATQDHKASISSPIFQHQRTFHLTADWTLQILSIFIIITKELASVTLSARGQTTAHSFLISVGTISTTNPVTVTLARHYFCPGRLNNPH